MKQVFSTSTNREKARVQAIEPKRASKRIKSVGLNQYIESQVLRLAVGESELEPETLRVVARIAGTTEALCLSVIRKRFCELEDTVARLRARVVYGENHTSQRLAA